MLCFEGSEVCYRKTGFSQRPITSIGNGLLESIATEVSFWIFAKLDNFAAVPDFNEEQVVTPLD